MHDASKTVLGAVGSSDRVVSDYPADPATFPAGLAVRLKSDGALSVTKADGRIVGVSLGRSLSDHKKTSVVRSGDLVPMLLELAPARVVVEVTSYANLVDTGNDTLKIGATTFTFKTSASAEGEVLCAASGSSNSVVAAALVAKINAHSVAGLLFVAAAVGAVVTITAKNNATLGSTIDCVYTDNGTDTIGLTVEDDAITFSGGALTPDYVNIGDKVYVSDTTGKADDPASGSTITGGIYRSGVKTGIKEDGTEAACVLVDMGGGL